jgi:hypothetical protein
VATVKVGPGSWIPDKITDGMHVVKDRLEGERAPEAIPLSTPGPE